MTLGEQPPSKRWLLPAWEYASEVVLALLISVLLFATAPPGMLHERLCSLRADLIVIAGGALAISVAVWGIFLAMLNSDFGAWLRQRNQASAYSRALATPIFGDLLGILLLLFSACSESRTLVKLNVFVLTYDLINLVTMVRNMNGLVGLWQVKEREEKDV